MVLPFRELPLLNTPSLMLLLLRTPDASQTTSVAIATQSLLEILEQAGEAQRVSPAEIAGRLTTLLNHLEAAALVSVNEDGTFAVTARGVAALEQHPQGFDLADLMAYPEFASHIRSSHRRAASLDPRSTGYDRGFAAYWTGDGPPDNPYAPDSADHLAWENGWSEALDEDFRWSGPHAAENRR